MALPPLIRRAASDRDRFAFGRFSLFASRRKDGHQPAEHWPEFGARYHAVDHAVLEQELGRLETLGELLASDLLDDARAGEPDPGARLGDDDVSRGRVAGRH